MTLWGVVARLVVGTVVGRSLESHSSRHVSYMYMYGPWASPSLIAVWLSLIINFNTWYLFLYLL